MVEITPTLSLEDNELRFDFIRASGPGGQNVNKVASAIKLYFDVRQSPSLPDVVKERLAKLAGKRMTESGVLVIDARRYRTQEGNRLDATQRLVALIQKALEEPTPRKKTRPSAAARVARLAEKKRRSMIKRERRSQPPDWEG
ncbi:MAG TPA: alternative ribosome rescue aminoacyl-tRNA hydrolase ArfB [Anaerolineales bacterium]